MKIALLVSGNLGFLALKHLYLNYELVFVMTNNDSIEIIEFVKSNKINYFIGNPRTEGANEFYSNKEIDVLISINYLFLINENLINRPKLLSFNIHGSLLPKYRGRTPHVWAIINNEKYTGITAHIIDNGCDTGDIIDQKIIGISDVDTGGTILEKFSAEYILMVESVLYKIKNNKIIRTKQNENEASYFGVRTPEDGLIDWSWQKERIYNWVRALSYPYPGAYSYYDNNKVIIDKIEFVNDGFDYQMPNGLIISSIPLLVKTPNGVVKLILRNKLSNITKGYKFY